MKLTLRRKRILLFVKEEETASFPKVWVFCVSIGHPEALH